MHRALTGAYATSAPTGRYPVGASLKTGIAVFIAVSASASAENSV